MDRLDPLYLKPTMDSPEITLDADKPYLLFTGRSFPADVVAFYKPILDWIEIFAEQCDKPTALDLKLDYFNTASSKILLDIIFKFDKMYKDGKNIKIKWHYPEDDEDMEETGEEYADIVDVPFEHIPYKVVYK